MELVGHTRKKLSAVLELVTHLQAVDFPHSHPQAVLDHLESLLRARLVALERLHADTDVAVVNAVCKEILEKIFLVYPLLGFLIRSTDVRNSFELHGPFLRLVKRALGKTAKLVISSEWDFSPFTYEMPNDLGLVDVVFIGIPASESGNGLAIPLAGHEFGHNIWRRHNFYKKYRTVVEAEIVRYITEDAWDEFLKWFPDVGDQTKVTDMLGQQYWKTSWVWALYQSEETFCDFIGLMLFREAYLHAFAYLLAPGLPGIRSENYPNMKARVEALEIVAKSHGIVVPENYVAQFEDSDQPGVALDQFLLSISDAVLKRMVNRLSEDATEFVQTKNLVQYSDKEMRELRHNFSLGIPATKSAGLSSIINAAWSFHREGMPEWRVRYPDIFSNEHRKSYMLSDLVFKSIEVLEISEIQDDSDAS